MAKIPYHVQDCVCNVPVQFLACCTVYRVLCTGVPGSCHHLLLIPMPNISYFNSLLPHAYSNIPTMRQLRVTFSEFESSRLALNQIRSTLKKYFQSYHSMNEYCKASAPRHFRCTAYHHIWAMGCHMFCFYGSDQ